MEAQQQQSNKEEGEERGGMETSKTELIVKIVEILDFFSYLSIWYVYCQIYVPKGTASYFTNQTIFSSNIKFAFTRCAWHFAKNSTENPDPMFQMMMVLGIDMKIQMIHIPHEWLFYKPKPRSTLFSIVFLLRDFFCSIVQLTILMLAS